MTSSDSPHASACPDQNTLQSHLIGAVHGDEAERLDEHISVCDSCIETARLLCADDELTESIRLADTYAGREDESVNSLIDRMGKLSEVSIEETVQATSATGEDTARSADLSSTQVGSNDEHLDFLAPPERPDEIGRLGGYRILSLLGTGGMGVVLRAEDPQLQRQVALKVMKPSMAAIHSSRDRFLREARATAAIEHDHIVQIYQVGEDNNVPFIAMRFLQGESLQNRLTRHGKLEQSEILRIGRQVAAGLDAAHQRGLIHRDIKPDNIWLESGTERVKIVDFGLVHTEAGEGDLTHSGMVLGTPRYMSPEQAQGLSVDHRCDLFSLGTVLYHLATGELPFTGGNTTAVLVAVAEREPHPVSELREDIDDELAGLITQLLSKQPDQRPSSAAEVVQSISDIEQRLHVEEADAALLADETTVLPAQDTGGRRNSRRAGFFVVSLLTAILAVIGGLWSAGIIFKVKTEYGTLRVEVNDDSLEVLVDGERITLTDKKWSGRQKASKHGLAIKLRGLTLDIGKDTVFQLNGRDVAHHVTVKLNGLDITSDEFEVVRGDNTVLTISFEKRLVSPAHAEVASSDSVSADGGWRKHLVLKSDVGGIGNVEFSPDGLHLASIRSSKACIWQLSDGKLLYEIKTSGKGLGWSPDGTLLGVSTKPGGKVKLFDTTEGRTLEEPLGAGGIDFVFAPDGETAAAVAFPYGKPELQIWNVAERKKLWSQPTPNAGGLGARCVTYSPDGKLVATGGEPAVTLRHADSGEVFARWQVPVGSEFVNDAAFSPDGKWLAVAADGGLAFIWELATGEIKFRLKHPWRQNTPFIGSVSFSPDGSYLAVGRSDGTVWLWNAVTGERLTELTGHAGPWVSVDFSPDGKLLAAAGEDGQIILWKREDTPSTFARELVGDWSEPVNLGPVVNSEGGESHPCLSTDGLTLLFSSDRAGGQGNSDLWMCTRTATTEPWSAPSNLGAEINSDGRESSPGLSSDGLTLSFASDRPGGHGDMDIWMCTRKAAGDSWSAPVNMGPNINSRLQEAGHTLSSDGLTFIFSAYVPGRVVDLFVCTRNSVREPWSERRNLGSINCRGIDAGPSLSADGRTLVFCSSRDENARDNYDLWIATRRSSNDPWSEPMNLGPRINTTHKESSPFLSADGRTLLFRSDRPGGEGGHDLWMSTRLDPPPAIAAIEPKQAITPGDGWVNLLPLIDANSDIIKGDFEWLAEGFRFGKPLTTEVRQSAKIQIPVILDGHYRLRMDVSPVRPYELVFPLPVGNHRINFHVTGGNFACFDPVDGKRQAECPPGLHRSRLSVRNRFQAVVEIRPFDDQVQLIGQINGEEVLNWTEVQDRLGRASQRSPTSEVGALGIAALGKEATAYEIHSLQLEVLDGEAKLLRPWEAWKAGLAPSPTEILTSPDWQWTDPEPIAELNTDAGEWGPTISADGLTMVFASSREGGVGDKDLWISERKSAHDRWGEARNLGRAVNFHRDDVHPELSSDGCTLLFTRFEVSGLTLFATTRTSRDEPWSKAERLGAPILDATAHLMYPCLSEDALTLMYAANWKPGQPKFRLHSELRISRRNSLSSPRSEPEAMGPPIGNRWYEWGPSLAADGLALLFVRGTGKEHHRVMATRASLDAPWHKPVPLPGIMARTDGRRDDDVELSADGREVYISRDGDIYVIRRVPKQPAKTTDAAHVTPDLQKIADPNRRGAQ